MQPSGPQRFMRSFKSSQASLVSYRPLGPFAGRRSRTPHPLHIHIDPALESTRTAQRCRERRAARAARAASSPGLLLLKKGPPSARSIQARRKGRGRRNAPSRPRAAARATATMTLRRPRPPAPPRRSRRESAASATNHCRRAPSAKISGKKVPKEGAMTAKGREEVEENLLHQMKKT